MKKRIIQFMGIVLLSVTVLAGCGSKSDYSSGASARDMAMPKNASVSSYAETDDIYNQDVEESNVEATGESKNEEIIADRKLIKTVNMDVETEEYDVLLKNVENKIDTLGGYIASLNSGENGGTYGDNTRYATVTAKIPADKVDHFVTEVSAVSNVLSKNETVDDVTLQYVDLESHKKALLTEQESLLKLMENATSMEDIISIESRLSDVRYQIESMESQLRTFDNQISYSEVTIYITEVARLTPVNEVGTWEKITTGFMLNVHLVLEGVKEFLIQLLIHLPFIVLFALIGIIVFFVVRAIDKMSKKHHEKKKALKKEQNTDIKAAKNTGEQNTPQNIGYGAYADQRNSESESK